MNGKRNHWTPPQGLVLFFETSKQCLSFFYFLKLFIIIIIIRTDLKKKKDATQKETVWLFQIERRKRSERSTRRWLFPLSPSKTQGHSWCIYQQALSVFSTTQKKGGRTGQTIHTNWPGAHS